MKKKIFSVFFFNIEGCVEREEEGKVDKGGGRFDFFSWYVGGRV